MSHGPSRRVTVSPFSSQTMVGVPSSTKNTSSSCGWRCIGWAWPAGISRTVSVKLRPISAPGSSWLTLPLVPR